MTDTDGDRIAQEVLAQVTELFWGKPPPKRKGTIRPCLVCGRHTKYAVPIHPNCRIKVGTEEAERLADEYFGKEK